MKKERRPAPLEMTEGWLRLIGPNNFKILAPTLFVLAFCAGARAQEPVPLARGNTPGEPHHHLKLENEYVRVYYVEAPPHEATQLHQHDHDYIYVSLGSSDVVNAILNKPEIHLQLKDGETHFTRGGFAHVARNLADTPFRNVTIELLKPQGDAHNLCSQYILSDPPGKCNQPAADDLPARREFETSECLVEVVQLSPRADINLHANSLAFLLVPLGDSRIRVSMGGKRSKTVQDHGMVWVDAGPDVKLANAENKTSAFLAVKFKDATPSSNP